MSMTEWRRLARRRVKEQKYRGKHPKLRRALEAGVAAGFYDCWRCGERIEPGEPWDLGHSDENPNRFAGPEHARCNRGAPNRLIHSRQW